MLLDRIRRKIQRALFGSDKVSYAQCGEDLIISGIFASLGVADPTYLDLGAHHPTYLSNTYYFYLRGGKGVCVEPDPALFGDFQKKRGRDTCLNVGVGAQTLPDAEFFLMSASTLNTFSGEEARRIEADTPHRIVRTARIPVVSVNQIIKEYFQERPDFVSLDIEGMDMEILQAFDFGRWHPMVFCVETVVFSERRSGASKVGEVAAFMESQGYFVYADTYINTIFVDKAVWADELDEAGR